MNMKLYREVLEIPTQSGLEDFMVHYLLDYINRIPGCVAWTDDVKNVYAIKGHASVYPCLAAHTDSVHPINRKIKVQNLNDDVLIGVDKKGHQAGIGADDKTGVITCLEALNRLDAVALLFLSYEECGGKGAAHASEAFMRNMGYVIEYDCPGRNLCSYTCSGIRLFHNTGNFINTAMPVLRSRGVSFQDHPYTDVAILRQRFPLSMLNLSSGYYNWHSKREYARISDTQHAVDMTIDLVKVLGNERYAFDIEHKDTSLPPMPVGHLDVTDVLLDTDAVSSPQQVP